MCLDVLTLLQARIRYFDLLLRLIIKGSHLLFLHRLHLFELLLVDDVIGDVIDDIVTHVLESAFLADA